MKPMKHNQDDALKRALDTLKKMASQNQPLEAAPHAKTVGCCVLKSPQGSKGQQDGVTENECINAATANGMGHSWKPGSCQ